MNKTYLLLGTNLGNRLQNLQQAIVQIIAKVGRLEQQSPVYKTAAWGLKNQQAFYNQVLLLATPLKAQVLLRTVLAIEKDMGRIRKKKWGERLIDIDVLYFNNAVIHTTHLTIPHPYLHKRRFTLVPLVTIAPDYMHPLLKKSNTQLLEECTDTLAVSQVDV